MGNFFEIQGKVIEVGELNIEKAKSLAQTILSEYDPYISLIECKRCIATKKETVILEIEIELGQSRVYEIRNKERIAVEFDPNDKFNPIILALREDFPQTPHQYLKLHEFPRSLCLFDEEYEDMKLYWTPTFLLNQIRNWLIKTAMGNLHEEDQPLEPFMVNSPLNLIIPNNIMIESNRLLKIQNLNTNSNKGFLFVDDVDKNEKKGNLISLAITIQTPEVEHGIINFIPENLEQLHILLHSKTSMDLLDILRKELSKWLKEEPIDKFWEYSLILILLLPQKRYKNSSPENIEKRAFSLNKKIYDIGESIGIWGWKDSYKGNLGLSIIIDKNRVGTEIGIIPLNIIPTFTRNIASCVNGESQQENRRFVAIGLGAIGSQIFLNLIRSGFGNWTLIDKDYLLPHNLARHALTNCVGFPKAEILAKIANNMIFGSQIAHSIVSDVLNPGEMQNEVMKAFETSDFILDMSVSIAVERYISRDIKSTARRISIFLNPNGTDSVFLVEDIGRINTLDFLEMQYYRLLLNKKKLENHLQSSVKQYRYSNSCRELSNFIPQDLVALHAANFCRRLKKIVNEKNASIMICQTNSNNLNMTFHNITPAKMIEYKLYDWKVCVDTWFIKKITKARNERLPKETGGVLIGTFDMSRKIIYIVDTISSPLDSKEWPTHYIRGRENLKEKLERICKITAGKLIYVGEWHSHSIGYKPIPSEDDRNLFNWICSNMKIDGLPGVMLIIGEDNKYRIFVDNIDNVRETD